MHQHLTKLFLAGVVAVILTVEPAHAFHKGVIHGGGEGPGETIQTLDSLAVDPATCPDGSFARLDPGGTGVWQCLSLFEALVALGVLDLTVFVTSDIYTGDLVTEASDMSQFNPAYTGSDGLEAGDFICNAHADAAGLPGPFVAWLSTTVVDAVDRLNAGSGPWVLTDGTQVAVDSAQLTSGGTLDVAISRNENNVVQGVTERVWTGTNFLGQVDGSTGNEKTCVDWTNGDQGPEAPRGAYGDLTAIDSNWTRTNLIICANTHRLYCFNP